MHAQLKHAKSPRSLLNMSNVISIFSQRNAHGSLSTDSILEVLCSRLYHMLFTGPLNAAATPAGSNSASFNLQYSIQPPYCPHGAIQQQQRTPVGAELRTHSPHLMLRFTTFLTHTVYIHTLM